MLLVDQTETADWGRKDNYDTYGYAYHGGGYNSGKGLQRLTVRSIKRYVAKNIDSAARTCRQGTCKIHFYAIGVAQPTSIMVDTFGTGKLSDEKIIEITRENFDLRAGESRYDDL